MSTSASSIAGSGRRTTFLRTSALVIGCCSMVGLTAFGQAAGGLRPASPLEPITAILDAFQSHPIVALGEGAHGNEQSQAFRLALIHDRRFAERVNDIVVESGNARYQALIDRFIGGDEVPIAQLQQVWQNTTQPNTVWDRPLYEAFYRAVRDVNASLPPSRRLRVLLGDPPVDWESIHTADDLDRWMIQRNSFPAGLIRREVLARGRKALVIYGDMHFPRLQRDSLVARLEREAGPKVFSIWTNIGRDMQTLDNGVTSWPTPSLAVLRGTALGAASFASWVGGSVISLNPTANASPAPPSPAMERQFDAVLYLGPPSSMTMAQLPEHLCTDAAYMRMRLQRMTLLRMPPGFPDPGDQLKRFCAAVAQK